MAKQQSKSVFISIARIYNYCVLCMRMTLKWGKKKKVPSPHGQTQLHHHKGLNACLLDFYHPWVPLRMEFFSFPHIELYHMKNNQPSHLFMKDFIIE